MKKLFALLAVVLAVVSCQKDADLDVNVGDEQLVNITVALPEATRADSAQSGWANTGNDLRVVLQIFDENGNTTDAMRFDEEKLTYGNTTVNYNVRLVPGHKYTFVAWADQGTEGQYFNTSNLKNVTFVDGAWTAMNENIDAYTDTETVEAGNSIRSINLVLTRPFAKVRVVATDINAVRAQGWEPTTAIATYQETVPVSFNAFAGVVGETAPVENPVRYVAYNNQYADNANAGEMTLFADYLYVPTSGTAKFEFAINGVDNNGNAIAIRNDIVFNTPIPAVRNKLTTIKGDILTNGSNIKVEVDEELPEYVMEIVEVETAEEFQDAIENTEVGEIILQKDITLDGSLTFGAPATTASTFATRANTDLPGRNITIDGNGKTLKVVKVGTGRVIDFTKETNGASLTLKNLTIENNVSWIERIVNYNTNGTLTLENVKIINAEGCKLNYAINLPGFSDNAKVVIKDSEIWANANALNLWGENTVANISRSKLYVVDSNNIEGYSVVALNNGGENAAHNSIINVEGGEIKVMYEGEGETKPSSALRDATVGSTINISNETVVVGDIIYPVAILTYTNTTDFYSFTTLQAAIDKAKGDANVDAIRLIKDVEATKVIEISDNVTIDGNGKTISTSANRIVRITNSNANVTINDVNFVSSAVMVYPSDVRGVSIDANLSNVALTLNNCTIDFTDKTTNDWTYAVNISGNGTGHKVTVNGGTYEGANVINAHGAKNTIVVKNATLTSLYPNNDVYYGACIWVLQNQESSVYAEGNTFNGDNAIAFNLGTGTALEEKNNVDNTTLFVANGLYKDTNKAYVVTNAEGLATLNEKMAKGTAGKGIVVNINADIDFTGKTWTPVDSHVDFGCYISELNGNGHTISNLTINGQAMFRRFAGTGDVVIKNITFDNATVNSNGTINTSILTVQSYQNVLLDNVDVKNSSITGGYKVAPLIATVYNEKPSTITATLKNCDVENTTVKATSFDFCTTGMVAFVNAGDNDAITFENCTVSNVKLYAPNVYTAHAAVYTTGSETLYNEVEGVTVTNVTFENI